MVSSQSKNRRNGAVDAVAALSASRLAVELERAVVGEQQCEALFWEDEKVGSTILISRACLPPMFSRALQPVLQQLKLQVRQ